ncbi:MAG: tRNA pseudouridine(55) synthase TruB [Bacteroidetes bacterium]|nr:tRNA pseudouridine(55) synthase TruB [Bacteroidota bacterium]
MSNLIDFSAGEVILIDKQQGISSFTIIRMLKRIVRIKKIGHAGTLDPMATGLVILCTGKMTKQIEQYQGQEKTYEGVITLGGITPSYDAETEVSESFDYSKIKIEDIETARKSFIGEIEQIPPIYSALKVGGERLYKKARKGEKVEIKSRKVEIYSFDILDVSLPKVRFRVKCSKGTYIRSLAYDFGRALHNGAYLTELRRTFIGDYAVSDALSIQEFEVKIAAAQEVIL